MPTLRASRADPYGRADARHLLLWVLQKRAPILSHYRAYYAANPEKIKEKNRRATLRRRDESHAIATFQLMQGAAELIQALKGRVDTMK